MSFFKIYLLNEELDFDKRGHVPVYISSVPLIGGHDLRPHMEKYVEPKVKDLHISVFLMSIDLFTPYI